MILETFDYEKNLSPISVFTAAREYFGSPCALLESAMTDERNQFSLIACVPIQSVITQKDSFDTLRSAIKKSRKINFSESPHTKKQDFPFSGGLIGYFNFEIFDEIEPGKSAKKVPKITSGTYPHAIFYEFSRFFAFDHVQKKIFAIQTTKEDSSANREHQTILENARKITEPHIDLSVLKDDRFADFTTFQSELQESVFTKKVSEAKKDIQNGEIFQMILSNGFKKNVGNRDGLEFYQALRKLEPTTHLVFFDFESHGQVCAASPEILGSKRGDKLLYSPIAGTRYRGKNSAEDERILKEMIADPKENAEHDMLVDLGRNDLGRVCETGSIKVEKEKYGRFFANVMHLVTDLVGTIKKDLDAVDFFKAIFPAGTLTGAPKIRAIHLIKKAEPNPRNLYGGALGYFSADGDMEFCIAIRSFFLKDGVARFRTGAGIVQDSDPKKEWLEVHNKAKSLCKIFNYVLMRNES